MTALLVAISPSKLHAAKHLLRPPSYYSIMPNFRHSSPPMPLNVPINLSLWVMGTRSPSDTKAPRKIFVDVLVTHPPHEPQDPQTAQSQAPPLSAGHLPYHASSKDDMAAAAPELLVVVFGGD